MTKINKDGFIKLVQKELGGTKVEAEKAVNAYHEATRKALTTPETQISLQGVWNIKSGMTKPRTMINQLSVDKEEIEIPSKLKLKVKVSDSFVG